MDNSDKSMTRIWKKTNSKIQRVGFFANGMGKINNTVKMDHTVHTRETVRILIGIS